VISKSNKCSKTAEKIKGDKEREENKEKSSLRSFFSLIPSNNPSPVDSPSNTSTTLGAAISRARVGT